MSRFILLVLLVGVVASQSIPPNPGNRPGNVAKRPLRWGIVGTGLVSHDWAITLESLPRDEHQLVSVADRNTREAATFARKWGAPKFGSLEDLAKDPNVDIVYVGTIHPTHYEISKMMLENNKHVLCEKPLTLLVEHAEELINLARTKKRFFQEGVWSRFFPAYKTLKDMMEDGAIGEVKILTANFGVNEPNITRLHRRHLGGGSLVEYGSYAIQFAVHVFGPEMPEVITAVATLNNESVDTTVAMSLRYKNGAIAHLSASTLADMEIEAMVYGTEGSLELPDYFGGPEEVVHTRTVDGVKITTHQKYTLPELNYRAYFPSAGGMVYEAQEVYRCIQEGLLESPLMTHQDSLVIARIEHEVEKQISVSYEELYKNNAYCGDLC